MTYGTTAERPRQRDAASSAREAAKPPAPKIFRRAIDPRLVIGIVLVVVSIVGTVAIVAGSDRTVAVYSVRDAVGRGQSIAVDDLVESDVALGRLTDGYLRVGSLPATELIATRALGAGELVPASAVESAAALTDAALVLPITGPVADGIVPGAAVQIWALPRSTGGDDAAAMLADGAEVRRIRETDGLLSSGGDVAVELIVAREAVPAVLEAQGDGASFALVTLDDSFAVHAPQAPTPETPVTPSAAPTRSTP